MRLFSICNSRRTLKKLKLHIMFTWCNLHGIDRRFNPKTVSDYELEYYANGAWRPLFSGTNQKKIKIHRFDRVKASKVRIAIAKSAYQDSIAEFQVYNEKR